jgi:hypothetical protein
LIPTAFSIPVRFFPYDKKNLVACKDKGFGYQVSALLEPNPYSWPKDTLSITSSYIFK